MNGFFEPRLAVLIVVVAGTLALAPAPASGHHIGCGDVVIADATLDSDLSDCPGDGIVIGADAISVDLNGHTIDGDDSNRVCEFDEETGTVVGGPNCFWDGTEDYGIDNGAGHDRVTISNGTVKSFAGAAILLGHWLEGDHTATENHLRGVSTGDSNYGFMIVNSDGNSIEDNSAHDNRLAGIWLSDSSHNLIERNRVSKNIRAGITLADVERGGSVGNRFYQNVVLDNLGPGIELLAHAGSNHVRGNVLRRNEEGIRAGGNGNRVEENLLVDNVTGILIAGRNTQVTGNRVSGSGRFGEAISVSSGGENVVERNATSGAYYGIILYATEANRIRENRVLDSRLDGITLWASSANHVIGNRVTRSGLHGISLGIRFISQDLNNRVQDNVVIRSKEDGIAIGAGSTGTLIGQNVASRNGDDGIDTDEPATTLTGNIARWNSDLGIEAAAGVLDGGANRAWKNGNPVQCLTVACRR